MEYFAEASFTSLNYNKLLMNNFGYIVLKTIIRLVVSNERKTEMIKAISEHVEGSSSKGKKRSKELLLKLTS